MNIKRKHMNMSENDVMNVVRQALRRCHLKKSTDKSLSRQNEIKALPVVQGLKAQRKESVVVQARSAPKNMIDIKPLVVVQAPSAEQNVDEIKPRVVVLALRAQWQGSVLVQALSIRRNLYLEHPVAVKLLGRCDICTALTLPKSFCERHLPNINTSLQLEMETGKQYETKYFQYSHELRCGWKRFATDNELAEGDLIVLHLIEATKFKVYIAREDCPIEHLPMFLLKLRTTARRSISDSKQLIVYKRRTLHQPVETSNIKRCANFGNADCSKLFQEGINFTEITNLEDFKAVTNALLQNCELPDRTLCAYYELCCSQSAFIHSNLFRGINPRLKHGIVLGVVERIISETVKIATAVKTCKLSTFIENFAVWDRTLNTYEALGMNVGFLCARLHHLYNLAFCSEGAADRIRYKQACHERGRTAAEATKLENILAKLRTVSNLLAAEVKSLKSNAGRERYLEVLAKLVRAEAETSVLEVALEELTKFFGFYDAEIETLKLKAKNHELKFEEEVTAPW